MFERRFPLGGGHDNAKGDPKLSLPQTSSGIPGLG